MAVLLLLVSNVLAITASIGNARMILNATTGDTIEKYILVKNVNNVAINIEVNASGDLEKYITVKDTKFTLAPGEEKQAYFTIRAAKEGTTESNINVKFTPLDGKNGVGLSSTVIVVARGKESSSWLDWLTGDNNSTAATGNAGSEEKSSPIVIGLIVTSIIFIILLILLMVYAKKKKVGPSVTYSRQEVGSEETSESNYSEVKDSEVKSSDVKSGEVKKRATKSKKSAKIDE